VIETKQNEIIISLLARMVFGEEKIKKIITHGKRNPNEWIRGYNSCDGKNGVTEIEKIVGVKQPTATQVLKYWKLAGILYNVGSETRPLYMKLLSLGD